MSAPIDYAKVAACVRRYQLMYSPGGECLEDAAKLCEAWPLVDELLDVMDGDSAYGELNSDVDAAYKRLRAELAK